MELEETKRQDIIDGIIERYWSEGRFGAAIEFANLGASSSIIKETKCQSVEIRVLQGLINNGNCRALTVADTNELIKSLLNTRLFSLNTTASNLAEEINALASHTTVIGLYSEAEDIIKNRGRNISEEEIDAKVLDCIERKLFSEAVLVVMLGASTEIINRLAKLLITNELFSLVIETVKFDASIETVNYLRESFIDKGMPIEVMEIAKLQDREFTIDELKTLSKR